MDFFLFLLVNATLFVRPAEILPQVQAWPIYLVLIAACLLLALPQVLEQLQPRSLTARPITACVVGVLGAILLSHLVHFRTWEARHYGIEFSKVLAYYLLVTGILHTTARLRTFLYALLAFTAVVAGLALLQYYDRIDIPVLSALQQREYDHVTGEYYTVSRLRSTGLFNDPNDLSMVLVLGMAVAACAWGDRRWGAARWLALGALGLFFWGLALTHSRGGLLAFLAGTLAYVYARYGYRRALALGGLGAPLLLLLLAGRQTDFSGAVSGGTGQSRVQLWSEGLSMFRAEPLFGVGFGQYLEEAGKVAHNSFLHCFAELGIVGGVLFLGAYGAACIGLWKLCNQPELPGDPELRRLLPCLFAVVVSYGVALMTLSRSYVEPTYMVLGLASAYFHLSGAAWSLPWLRFDQRFVARFAAVSVLFIASMYVFVRVFARWS